MNVDTLSIPRELRAADLPSVQAQAIAAAIGRAVAELSATKPDLDLARSDLKHDSEQVRTELKREIEQVRTDVERAKNQLIFWVITSQVTLAGIIIAVIKL